MKLAKLLFLFFAFLIGFENGNSQTNPKWLNYSPAYLINTIVFEGNIAWLGTYGSGLIRMDTITGQKTIYNGANSGLSLNSVNTILVDHSGNKWIGLYPSGLHKFDGTNWTSYNTFPNGNELYDVQQITEDRNGNIFVLAGEVDSSLMTSTKKLIKISGSTMTVVDSTNDATCFDIDTLGNPSIGRYGGVSRFNGSHWINYDTLPSGATLNNVWKLKFDTANGLWAQCGYSPGCTVYHLSNSVWYSHALGVLEPVMSNIYKDTLGWWFYAIHTSQNKIKKVYETTVTNLMSKPSQNSYIINTDPAGHFWFSGFFAGGCILFEYLGSNWKTYRFNAEPFYYPYLNSIAIDGMGNKWIAFNGDGLYKFDGFVWTSFKESNSGIPDDNVTSVFVDHNDNIWVTMGFFPASSGSVNVAKFDGTTWTTFSIPGGMQNISVTEIVEDGFGSLWMASYDGLLKYDGTTWTLYSTQNSPLLDDYIFAITIDHNNVLWLASYGKGLVRFDGTNWAIYDTANSGITDNYVTALGVDCSNNVWVRAGFDILSFDGLNWTPFNFPNNFRYTGRMKSNCDPNGRSWIGFINAMLRYDGSTWTDFTPNNSGLTGNVEDFALDQQGRLWIATMAGLCVFDEDGIDFDEVHNIPPTKVSGNVYYDTNNNGIKDLGTDPNLNHQKVKLTPGNTFTFTNPQGNYSFYCQPGLYKTQFVPYTNWVLTSDSAFYTLHVDTVSQSGFDFGAAPTLLTAQAEIILTHGSRRCLAPASYWISYRNNGSTLLNGKICFVPDYGLTYNTAYPLPDSINGDTLIWNYSNLAPFDGDQINVRLTNPPINTLGANTVSSKALMFTNSNGILTDSSSYVIACSFDPNEKEVIPAGVGTDHQTLISETLEYTIHFENTGNDTAFTIYVLDTLDKSLDINSFDVIGSSHQVSTSVDSSGLVMFRFNHINLLWTSFNAAASQGFVKYSIKAKNATAPNTVVKNRAHIYFDYNLAIKTNEVFNTLVTVLGTNEVRRASIFNLFPNPASKILTINCSERISLAKVFNLSGQLILEESLDAKQLLDISTFKTGVYFVELFSNNKVFHAKFVKQ